MLLPRKVGAGAEVSWIASGQRERGLLTVFLEVSILCLTILVLAVPQFHYLHLTARPTGWSLVRSPSIENKKFPDRSCPHYPDNLLAVPELAHLLRGRGHQFGLDDGAAFPCSSNDGSEPLRAADPGGTDNSGDDA